MSQLSQGFGNLIARLRKSQNLTQKQLADKLNVSDKAVSRWETGKNYPDIDTIKRISSLFDISVDELLEIENSCGAPRKRFVLKWLLPAVLAALLLAVFPVHHFAYVSSLPVYSANDAKILLFRGFPDDRRACKSIIQEAENAFSDLSCSRREATEKYGLLRRYCFDKDSYPDVVSEKHKLSVWSVRLNTYTSQYDGYIWVCYSNSGFDASGKEVTGSSKVPALWCLDRAGDNWKIVKIIEAP